MYNIQITRHFYGPGTSVGLVEDGNFGIREFPTLEEANAWIDLAETAPYYLAHNESGRPDFKPVLTPEARKAKEEEKAKNREEFRARMEEQRRQDEIWRKAPYKMVPAPRANPDSSLYGPWIVKRKKDKKVVCRGHTRDHCEEVFQRYCSRRNMDYMVAIGWHEGPLYVHV